MAHLWTRRDGEWGARRLDSARYALDAYLLRQAGEDCAAALDGRAALLIRVDAGGAKTWALMAPADCDVCVNSGPLLAGLRVLADRDEIWMDGLARYFSTETLAAVEAFPGAERAVFCGRCRQKIEPGTPAVCCPGCNIWYHQDESASLPESERLPCWTYSEKCAYCGHPTALDMGFAWTPEEER